MLRRRLGRQPPDRARASPVESRRRRLLQHLLVAALQRAVALAQMHDVAVLVGEDLHLDVPRPREVLLQVELAVAERRLRLGARHRHRRRQLRRGVHHLHAAAAAAGRRLDQHRIADGLGDRARLVLVLHRAVGAGDHRDAGAACRPASPRPCRPSCRMCSGDGPMKAMPCSSTIAAKSAFSERKP